MAHDNLNTKHDRRHKLKRPFSWAKNLLQGNGNNRPQASAAETLPKKSNTHNAPSSSSPVGGQSISTEKDRTSQSHSTASDPQAPGTQTQPDLWQEALYEAQKSTDWKSHKKEYDEAVQKCLEINQNTLNGNTNDGSTNLADAISNHLQSLQRQVQERQWGYENSKGETIYFRDVLTRIVKWVGVFKDPGNQLAGLDPTKAASLVWGFVQFFVERAVVYSGTRDLAIDQEPIANLLSRYALIENFHLNNNPGGIDSVHNEVRKKISQLVRCGDSLSNGNFQVLDTRQNHPWHTVSGSSRAQGALEFDYNTVK
ncbi:hypothetical protein PENVUL_c008G05221 [Penicillium vulpinum]|uniref:NWD NACHT-NTPase N-terminal domain-containing protein n=1 Tax=Penicillium vulpinum TaxID=29845 RepID=A0A1V6S515_9EURO|nr:hypothetical protein PENVUL_c008G05221 [Penicillium vulpinum]